MWRTCLPRYSCMCQDSNWLSLPVPRFRNQVFVPRQFRLRVHFQAGRRLRRVRRRFQGRWWTARLRLGDQGLFGRALTRVFPGKCTVIDIYRFIRCVSVQDGLTGMDGVLGVYFQLRFSSSLFRLESYLNVRMIDTQGSEPCTWFKNDTGHDFLVPMYS